MRSHTSGGDPDSPQLQHHDVPGINIFSILNSHSMLLTFALWRSEPEMVLSVLRPRFLLSCLRGFSDKMSSSSSNDFEPDFDE